MQHLKQWLFIVTTCAASTAWSQDTTTHNKTQPTTSHIIGIQADIGAIDVSNNENTKELKDITSFHYSLSYQYQFNDYFSAGISYLDGDSESFTSIVDAFTDSELEYSAYMFSAIAQYPLPNNNSIYLKVSTLQYDFDIKDDNEVEYSHDGSDIAYGIGWKHQFGHGLGVQLGYEIINLGKDIKISSVNAGLSYHF